MLRGTGAAVKPISVFFSVFGEREETWRKGEVFSHSLIEQAVLAGISWINVKSNFLTKPHERHKAAWGLELQCVHNDSSSSWNPVSCTAGGAMSQQLSNRVCRLALAEKLVRCNYTRWREICVISTAKDEGFHMWPGCLFYIQLQWV